MSYDKKTGKVLSFLGYTSDDYSLENNKTDGLTLSAWNHADPQPTEQEITDTAASQAFLDWEAENGGDPTKTARRIAKEAVATPAGMLLVALIVAMKDQGAITGTKQQIINTILSKIDAGDAD